MTTMFRGQFEHAIDEKGRTSLPARFRDVLVDAKEVVLTPSLFDPCIELYPLRAWQELEEKIAELPRFDPQAIQFRRRYVSAAIECELDKQGRILVPTLLRGHAGLTKDALWRGVGKTAELWSKERWVKALEMTPTEVQDFKTFVEHLAL